MQTNNHFKILIKKYGRVSLKNDGNNELRSIRMSKSTVTQFIVWMDWNIPVKMKLRQADKRWGRGVSVGHALCRITSQSQIYQNFALKLMADNVSIKLYDWYTCRKLINWSERVRRVKGALWKHLIWSYINLYKFEGDIC